MSAPYIGRFAPSPTGPLHFGSLLAALASYLDARANRGLWLIRVDDIDPPREQSGADTAILSALQRHGLQWDREPLWQSTRRAAHDDAIDQLLANDQAFHCSCSRRDLAASGNVYPGTCRNANRPASAGTSIRLKVDPDAMPAWSDRVQREQKFDHENLGGDFVIRRKDQLIAYQLACAVDDTWQGITDVVRGSDLLESTARQIQVMSSLGKKPPRYAHIPVVVDSRGAKLSKQTGAEALDPDRAEANLVNGLELLGQELPSSIAVKECGAILGWAVAHWSPARIPRITCLPI